MVIGIKYAVVVQVNLHVGVLVVDTGIAQCSVGSIRIATGAYAGIQVITFIARIVPVAGRKTAEQCEVVLLHIRISNTAYER